MIGCPPTDAELWYFPTLDPGGADLDAHARSIPARRPSVRLPPTCARQIAIVFRNAAQARVRGPRTPPRRYARIARSRTRAKPPRGLALPGAEQVIVELPPGRPSKRTGRPARVRDRPPRRLPVRQGRRRGPPPDDRRSGTDPRRRIDTELVQFRHNRVVVFCPIPRPSVVVMSNQEPSKARDTALQGALSQIERQFGKGTVMRMGDPGRSGQGARRSRPARCRSISRSASAASRAGASSRSSARSPPARRR